jgi:hypothetical protein
LISLQRLPDSAAYKCSFDAPEKKSADTYPNESLVQVTSFYFFPC